MATKAGAWRRADQYRPGQPSDLGSGGSATSPNDANRATIPWMGLRGRRCGCYPVWFMLEIGARIMDNQSRISEPLERLAGMADARGEVTELLAGLATKCATNL